VSGAPKHGVVEIILIDLMKKTGDFRSVLDQELLLLCSKGKKIKFN